MSTFTGISLKTMQFTLKPNGISHFNNFKIVKFNANIQPFVLVKNTILNNQDMQVIQDWNTRKLVLFNFEDTATYGLLNNEVGKVIAQYTDLDFTSYNFTGLSSHFADSFISICLSKNNNGIFGHLFDKEVLIRRLLQRCLWIQEKETFLLFRPAADFPFCTVQAKLVPGTQR